MTDLLFWVFRTFFITIMTVGMMASMTEFRFGRWKLLCIMAVYSVWVVASSLVLLRLGGELLLLRLFFLTISIPATLLTYWAASDTPAQAVFNYMTQILVSTLSASMIRWVTESLGLSRLVNILLMCVFYLTVIYLEWHFLRRPFRMLIQVMPSRWGVLTLIPCVFCGYLILVSSWPGSYLENEAQRIYVYATVIPLVFVYIAVFKSLLAQYHIQMERQSTALLKVQISALKEKIRRTKEVMVGTPGVMLELSNPCAGNIAFDSGGVPVSRQEGHGLGVQSISAFCRKNGAVCQFDLTDGWFRLRLVL